MAGVAVWGLRGAVSHFRYWVSEGHRKCPMLIHDSVKLEWEEPARLRWALSGASFSRIVRLTAFRFVIAFAACMALALVLHLTGRPTSLRFKIQFSCGLAGFVAVVYAAFVATFPSSIMFSSAGISRFTHAWWFHGVRIENWPIQSLQSISIEDRVVGGRVYRTLVLVLSNGGVQRIGIPPEAESRLAAFLARSNAPIAPPIEADRVVVTMLKSSWLRRVFEIKSPEGTIVVEFNGRRTGKDSFPILVGHKTQRLPVTKSEYGRRYQFRAGRVIGNVDIRTTPWMTLRTIKLWVADRLLYSEG
jgi:hypothetical protein